MSKTIRLTEQQLKTIIENKISENFGYVTLSQENDKIRVTLMKNITSQIGEILIRGFYTKSELLEQISSIIKHNN